jgi:hypothetical protein
LRQTSSGALLGWLFYLPMAVIGVPPLVFGTVALIDLLYQFWVHTRQVGKLGWFDRWFCSPSNHRVHHAVNPHFLDRNYGGMLMIWDRLFGTYAEESGTLVYGVTKRLRSFNPLRAQLDGWVELLDRARRLRGLDRLRVLWRPPGWSPGGPPAPMTEEELRTRRPLPPGASPAILRYALVQFVPLTVGTILLLVAQVSLGLPALAAGAALVYWALLSLGGLVDGRRWAVPLELARLAALAGIATALVPAEAGALAACGVLIATAGALAAWLVKCAARPGQVALEVQEARGRAAR